MRKLFEGACSDQRAAITVFDMTEQVARAVVVTNAGDFDGR
jgi:hypothetical protein